MGRLLKRFEKYPFPELSTPLSTGYAQDLWKIGYIVEKT